MADPAHYGRSILVPLYLIYPDVLEDIPCRMQFILINNNFIIIILFHPVPKLISDENTE